MGSFNRVFGCEEVFSSCKGGSVLSKERKKPSAVPPSKWLLT